MGSIPKRQLQLHVHRLRRRAGFGTGVVDGFAAGDGHAHAAFAVHVRLAEQAQLRVGHVKGGGEVAEANVGALAFHEDNGAGAGAVLGDVRDRQAEDGACVQGKLREVL